jgi:parvulin-like peptidyl-prolyl isomerase
MNRRWLLSSLVGVVVGGTQLGCWHDPEPKPLGADQFYRPTDRGGALPPGPQPRAEQPTPQSHVDQQKAAENAQFVKEQVRAPSPIPDPTLPSADPAPAQPAPSFAPGQFINVGGVLAEVKGNPIYVHDVLRSVAPVLASRAKELDEKSFRALAAGEINRQLDEMIRAEITYAAADDNTTAEDKQNAQRMTEAWRQRIITANKGSIEEARKYYREQDRTFEDVTKEQYRINLVRVYQQKKILPRIQVSADDMRRFYEKNHDTMFTDRDNATFRIIKVNVKDLNSDEKARQKIEDIAARARRGDDFAQLAASFNQDADLQKSQGLIGPIDRGAYILEDVEKAVWSANVGETTPVIKIGETYYLAQVVDKKKGREKAFEEDEVQKKMFETLRAEQFAKLRKEMEETSRRDAVVSKNNAMFQTALDMAMQNYPRWHQSK